MDENSNINLFLKEFNDSDFSTNKIDDTVLDIINLSVQIVLITNLNGKILFLNNAASNFFGVKSSDPANVYPIDSLLQLNEVIRNQGVQGSLAANKAIIRTSSRNPVGLETTLFFVVQPVFYTDQNCVLLNQTIIETGINNFLGLTGIAENDHQILNLIPALIFVKDMENRIIWVNKSFEEITGLKASTIFNKKISEIVDDSDLAEEYWKDDKEIIETGIPKRNIIEHLITDKSKWFMTDKIPLKSDNGDLKGILGFSVEISERKYAEESLMSSEQRFRLFFETSPDSIIICDLDCNIQSINPAFESLTGFAQDEIEDLSFFSLTPDHWPVRHEEQMMVNKLKNEKIKTITIEKEYLSKTKKAIPVRITGWLIRDELHNPFQFCIYAKDMTFEKKADELEKSLLKKEKEELSKDLEAKNRELNTKITQLIEKTEMVGSVITQLEKIRQNKSANIEDEIFQVINDLKRHSTGNFWSQFEYTFGQINQSFYDNLFKAFPNLTNNEKKICAFLKMNLSTKDISAITHQSARSIEIARSRLRNRMNLSRSENLTKFLNQF